MAFVEGHALIIGVGSNKHDPRRDVPITVRDAEAVTNILIDPATCGYPEDQVEFLHDETATTEGVLAALERLAERVNDNDTAFIYFAGHGAFSLDSNYYLGTHDAEFFDTSDLVFDKAQKKLFIKEGRGLSQQVLVEKLKAIKAEKVLMIFNACHSGSLQTQSLGGDTVEEQKAQGQSLPAGTASALLSTGEGRMVISACKPDQLSSFQDKKDNLTWFTEALVNGLKGESFPTNGYISAFNLYFYVYQEVTRTAANQDPMLTVLQNAGTFPIALATSSVHGPGEAEPEGLPQGGVVNEVSKEYSRAWLTKIEEQTIVMGDYVEGDKVLGDKIDQQINTAGGAVFLRGVTASTVVGGDLVNIFKGAPQIKWPLEAEDNYLRRVRSEFNQQIASRLVPTDRSARRRSGDLYIEPVLSARETRDQAETTRTGTWNDLVKTETFRGLLIGDTHDGKSLFLMKIAHDLALSALNVESDEKRDLPVYMSVSRFPSADAANAELLLAIAAYTSGQSFESFRRTWYEGERRVALLIDDVDLLPAGEQDAFVNAVGLLSGSLAEHHSLVVTCRSGVSQDSLKNRLARALQSDPLYTEWVILPLTPDRIMALLDRYGAAEWLRKLVSEDKGLGVLVNKPGTLSALIQATEGLSAVKAPQNLAQLYQLFIDGHLFKRHENQMYDYRRAKQPVLSFLAFRLLETRQNSLKIDDVLYRDIVKELEGVAQNYRHSRRVMPEDWHADEWFREIYDSPIINQFAAQSGRFEFASPVYRDYYAALYLSNIGDKWQDAGERIKKSGLENWFDALILLSGMAVDETADKLLNHALSTGAKLAADLWLEKGTVDFSRVPDCVEEDFCNRRPNLPERIDGPVYQATRYFQNVARRAEPETGLQVVNGLMQLGVEAIDTLLDAVKSPHPIVAASAVHALFHMGEFIALGQKEFEPLIITEDEGFSFNNMGTCNATIGDLQLVQVPRMFRADMVARFEHVDFDIFSVPSSFELWHTPVAWFAIDFFIREQMVDWIGLAGACHAVSHCARLIADKAREREKLGPIVNEMVHCSISYNQLGSFIASDLNLPWQTIGFTRELQWIVDNTWSVYRELRLFFNRTNRSRMLRQSGGTPEGISRISLHNLSFSRVIEELAGTKISGTPIDEIAVESGEEVDLPDLIRLEYADSIEHLSDGKYIMAPIGHVIPGLFLAAEVLSVDGSLYVEYCRNSKIQGIVIERVERWDGIRVKLKLYVEQLEASKLVGIKATAPEEAYINYDALFAPLEALIPSRELVAREDQATGEDSVTGQVLAKKVNDLKTQVTKGAGADDERIATLILDITDAIPVAVAAITSLFTNPDIAAATGPATRYVLGRLKRRSAEISENPVDA